MKQICIVEQVGDILFINDIENLEELSLNPIRQAWYAGKIALSNMRNFRKADLNNIKTAAGMVTGTAMPALTYGIGQVAQDAAGMGMMPDDAIDLPDAYKSAKDATKLGINLAQSGIGTLQQRGMANRSQLAQLTAANARNNGDYKTAYGIQKHGAFYRSPQQLEAKRARHARAAAYRAAQNNQ